MYGDISLSHGGFLARISEASIPLGSFGVCLPIAGGKEGDKFTTMEAKNWWFVDVSPFPRGYVQVPAFSFQGIYMTMGPQN